MVLPIRESELRPGDKLGPYQLLAPIGAGGMGRVWVARLETTHGFERVVALKTALTEAAADQDFRDYFLDEGRLAAMIDHPNVCRVQDLGEDDGVLYMTMEWVDGPSLHQLLSVSPQRRLDWGLAVHIVAQVCAGLHAAHELEDEHGERLQVVHRDVSPQNVLLTASGQVKLTDFGVAKAKGQAHRATETGELKGKLSYMAPEQVSSKHIDRRADVFAAGCVLYEAVTGVKPFHAADAVSAMYNLLVRPLANPSQLREGLPIELEQIVLRALERSPDDRYQSAEELRRALEGWLQKQPTRPGPRDLATLIETSLGEALEHRRQLVRDRVTAAAVGANLTPPTPDTQPTIIYPEPSVAGISHTRSRRPPGGTDRRNRWALTGIALAGVAAAAVVFTTSARQTEIPPIGTVRSSASATHARVTLRIGADVPGASAQVDDGAPVALPATLTLEARQQPRVVAVSAPGHELEVRQLSGLRDGELQLALRPVANTASAAAPSSTAVPARQVATGGRPRASATAAPAPKAPVRARVLDKTNPFLDSP